MIVEALLAAAALLLAVACLLLPALAPTKRFSALLALAALIALLFSTAATLYRPAAAERDVDNRPVQVADDGYVSSSACRGCHPSNYASWHASWHRTMTQVATPRTVVGNFDDVTVAAYGKSYRLERRDDEFWVELDDPEAESTGASPQRVWRRILMTTGSHHEQDYWFETGHTRKLGFLPLMYLIADRKWVPFDAGFMGPPGDTLPGPGELDRWESSCIKCHATHGKPRTILPDDERNMDTTVAELGIACEACHGPAAEHVRANRDPARRYLLHFTDGADDTIINPARLPPEKASMVCGQCHAVHRPLELLPRNARLDRDWRDHGLAYRPGDDLNDVRYLIQASKAGEERFEEIRLFDPGLLDDRFWNDGTVRISGREYNGLVESPCYLGGTGDDKLTCFSCHSMHQQAQDRRHPKQWADDQLAVGMEGNAACLQCHERFAGATALAEHTHHQPGSSGSRCYNCHMPYTTYGLLKAIRSHTIDSPDVAATRDTGRPNACSLCHLDRGMRWTSEHLQQWYGAPDVELPMAMAAVPSSLVWLLSGDAGQRALAAWAMGWEPAMAASPGPADEWRTPFLAQLLIDPYAAVRYIAYRSLRRQPGQAELAYDYVGAPEDRLAVMKAVKETWTESRRSAGESTDQSALLGDSRGAFPPEIFEMLYRQRNDRRVSLRE